jgi:peptide/nickel transport system substrate-binding protein
MAKKIGIIGIIVTIVLLTTSSITLVEGEQKYEYGGTLRFPVDQDNVIQPLTNVWNINLRIFALMYDRLVITDQYWHPIPWLAQSWEFSEDGKTITFHLVENATWHDGDPVTAEDVKFTYDYSLEHQTPYVVGPDGDAIESIEAPDPYTVVFHTKRTVGTSFIERLCTRVNIVKKSEWEDVEDPFTFYPTVGKGLTGSGPFKFARQESGQYLELAANEDYWAGRPYLDRLFSVVIPQHDMQLMAFEKGEIDIVWIRPADVAKFLGMEGVKIFKTEAAGFTEIAFNTRRPPFSDRQLRKALSYCIPRDFLIETIYFGYAYKNLHHLPPAYLDWVNPDAPVYEYDLDKAAEILDAAGYVDNDGDGWRDYPDGSTFKPELKCSSTDIDFRQAEIIAESMKEVGLNVVLESGSGMAFWDSIFNEHDFDMCRMGWTPDTAWPGEMLSWYTTSMAGVGGLNIRGLSNATLDAIDLEAASEADPDRLKEILYEMQMIIAEECPNALIIRPHALLAVYSEKFEGFENAIPFGPLSYLDMIGFMQLHLKGAVAATTTLLTLSVPSTGTTDEVMSVSATLTTEDGTPIEEVYVDFSAGGLIFGSAMTDSEGKAGIKYLPETEGDVEFMAEYLGSADYAACESDIETSSVSKAEEPGPVGPTPTPPPEKPDYTMYYVGVIVILLIVVVALFMRSRS